MKFSQTIIIKLFADQSEVCSSCMFSNGNKLEIVANAMNLNTNLNLSKSYWIEFSKSVGCEFQYRIFWFWKEISLIL